MGPKTQYFMSTGLSAIGSQFVIKFDGQYSYWGNISKQWIHDPTILKQSWIENYFKPISEREAQKIIKEGVSPYYYRRRNPKLMPI